MGKNVEKQFNESAQVDKTRNKVSMGGARIASEQYDDEQLRVKQLVGLAKIRHDHDDALKTLNDKLTVEREDAKKDFLECLRTMAANNDRDYEMKRVISSDFTKCYKTSANISDEKYEGAELFGKKTMHRYAFTLADASYSELCSMWDNLDYCVPELKAQLLKRQAEKRKAQQDEKKAVVRAAMIAGGMMPEAADAIIALM